MSWITWALLSFPATSGRYTAALRGPDQLAHTLSSMLKREMSKESTSVAGSCSLWMLLYVDSCVNTGALSLSARTSASPKGLALLCDWKQAKLSASGAYGLATSDVKVDVTSCTTTSCLPRFVGDECG